jgi:hypothetical protein
MGVMEQHWTRRRQQDCKRSSLMPRKHPYALILRTPIGREYCERTWSDEDPNLWQLLSYTREWFGFQRVAVIPTSNNLKQRICEGMLMSMAEFVIQTVSQIYSPGNLTYGSGLNNICVPFCAQLPEAPSFVKLLAESAGINCSMLLMGAVEY